MRVIAGKNNVHTMLLMYGMVAKSPEVEIRGSKVRNVSDMAIILDARSPIITNYPARKMNLAYAKREWLWYLGADRMDDSICEHATMWQKLKQEDGSFFSNYGQYIFGEPEEGLNSDISQFEYVIKQLKSDHYSRRASIVLLQPYHLFEENKDTVCTYAINFHIESGKLDMTVMMRSNDVIFGFTNDAFCFSMLYQYVFAVLKHTMPDLLPGTYTHFANSMHVYERHYDMIRSIVGQGEYTRLPIVPLPTAEEALSIVRSKGKQLDGEHGQWLKTFD